MYWLRIEIFICLGPPIITFISPHTIVSEGKEAKLSCIVTNDEDAEDPLHIQWLSPNGVQIESNKAHPSIRNTNNTILGQLQSVLSFYSANRSDNGEYACQAFYHIKSYAKSKTNLTVECT